MTATTEKLESPSPATPTPFTPDVSLHYTLDVHDVLAAVRLQLDHDPHLRRHMLVYRWGLPLVFILIGWISYALDGSVIWLIGAAFIGLFFYCAMSSGTRAGVARAVAKRFKKGSPRGIVGPHEMVVTAAGLVARTAVNASTHAWGGLDRVIDTGDCLFVYVTPFAAHIVPRNTLQEGDYDAFVAAMQAHVEVRRVAAGESFDKARAAGLDPKPRRRQSSRALSAIALGMAICIVWSGAAGELIAALIPSTWPEALWWLSYNTLMGLPGVTVAALAASTLIQRDRESFCRRCGHLLRGLSQPQCTECGETI